MLTIPKSMANQSVTFKKLTGHEGPYQKAVYDDPVEIKNCVFQPQTIYSGTNNNRQIIANAVLFIYAGISDPVPKITDKNIGSKVIFEGNSYTVQKLVDNRHPFDNGLFSYELEVL